MLATSFSSVGNAVVPEMTLNRMYHWVPRIISGDSQISGLSSNLRISTTTAGNTRFAGNAARNCTTGCTRSASCGLRPIHTPTGTQISEAMTISTMMRSAVNAPSRNTQPISSPDTCSRTNAKSHTTAALATPSKARSKKRIAAGDAGPVS